ncbi:MAG: hypothetical protein AAGJ70_06835 [Pseudomonadota bacterium]
MIMRTLAVAGAATLMMSTASLACSWNKSKTTAEAKPAQSTIAQVETQPAQSDVATARKTADHDKAQAAVDAPADDAKQDVADASTVTGEVPAKPKS